MEWQDLNHGYQQRAAELIGTIDSGERWIFEHSDKDSDFRAFVCNKILDADNGIGVISAAIYREHLRISIAFQDDLPVKAEEITAQLLLDTVKSTEQNTYFWCKNENTNLRRIIENTFQVSLDYASHEMSISKIGFSAWKAPYLPLPYHICSYDASRHDEYIQLLEQAMRHVSPPGTTPYLNRSESLKSFFTTLDQEKRFHAMIADTALVGVCYSEGGEINTLAIDQQHRGKGLGYALLYTAIQNAFSYREGDICLYVVDHNPGAFEFYKRCGMSEAGHSARYFIDRQRMCSLK